MRIITKSKCLYSGLSDKPADPRINLYGRVVKKYCDDNENINKQSVGGGLTCEDMGASREEWCSVDQRIQTEPSCSKPLIGDEMYHKMSLKRTVSPTPKMSGVHAII